MNSTLSSHRAIENRDHSFEHENIRAQQPNLPKRFHATVVQTQACRKKGRRIGHPSQIQLPVYIVIIVRDAYQIASIEDCYETF